MACWTQPKVEIAKDGECPRWEIVLGWLSDGGGTTARLGSGKSMAMRSRNEAARKRTIPVPCFRWMAGEAEYRLRQRHAGRLAALPRSSVDGESMCVCSSGVVELANR